MKKILSILLALITSMLCFVSCGPDNEDSQGQQSQTSESQDLSSEGASDSQGAGSSESDTENGSSEDLGEDMQRLDSFKLIANVDEIVQYDFANEKIFGSAYYVYQNGVVLQKCYGVASPTTEAPITDRSIFRLASMTKPITAVATLILVERGLLSLDDRVNKYIPEFEDIKIIDAKGNESFPKKLPTIRQILSHTSGIVSDQAKLTPMTVNDKKTLDSSIAYYIKKGLDYEPGTKQMYSGFASFDVLTKIIEIVTETDYLTFLQREIFEPCGMTDTTFEPTQSQQERIVDMHHRVNGESVVSQMPEGCIFDNFPTSHYLGGAGLVSTLRDYARFAKMLLNKGKVDGKAIISEQTFELLCTPQVDYEIMPQSARWGLGVRVITEDTYPYLPVGTFGWSGAYGSHFWVDPVNKIFAVFMKNSKVDGGAGNESAVKFEKAVYTAFSEE